MALPVYRQPLKAFYIAGVLLTFALLRLPYLVLTYIVPALRPNREWTLKRVIIVSFMREVLFILMRGGPVAGVPAEVAVKDADKNGFVWVEPVPKYIVGELADFAKKNSVEPARFAGFWYGKTKTVDGVAPKAKPGEKALLHIHSGGFCMGSSCPADPGVQDALPGIVKYLPEVRVFSADYRLAAAPPFVPSFQNPFPAAVLDCLAAYCYLVEDVGFEPKNIILWGESGGSSILCGLMHHLRQHNFPALQVPGALIHISPAVDWANTHDGPGASLRQHALTDSSDALYVLCYPRRAIGGALGDVAADSFWVSPGSRNVQCAPGALKYPRTLMFAGGAEVLLDSIREFRDRVRADIGDELTYIEQPLATHAALLSAWHEPEYSEGLSAVAAWVQKL